ncbi:MAG TPA: hypothetical protein PKJ16_09410 [Spirochaetota bacterium]|nr:hypothetical protein [Spirochaetota bacterium]HOS38821.1 hypothetical protein [Spirochaetota bacterium]HPU86905.1 hypothetical protein [Spirochaetota bacterium]
MSRNMSYILSAVILLPILFILSGAHAEEPVLTDEIVTKYEATYPAMWQVTQELDKTGKMPNSEEKDRKTQELLAKRAEILKENGWNDLWEYLDTMGRITRVFVPLKVLAKFANRPEEDRKKAVAHVQNQLKGYSEEEIKTLMLHLPKLNEMLEKSGQIPKDK